MQNQSSFWVLKASLKRGACALAFLTLLTVGPATAVAASSWNPTLLVNTESFNVIDDGDGTTDIEIRFGSTVDEKLFWDLSENRFKFTRSLYIQGDLTATGSLAVQQNISASGALKINDDDTGDATMTFGNASADETLKFDATNHTFEFSDDLDVTGTISGSGNLSIEGTSYLKGNVTTDGNLTINGDSGGANAVLTFGNDAGDETIQFNDTTNEFDFSDDINVTGTIDATSGISGSGILSIDGAAYLNSTLTVGSTITLNGATYTFPASDGSSTGQVLATDASGNLSWISGDSIAGTLTQTDGDARYVEIAGDTMTGALVINDESGAQAGLEVIGTASGTYLHATSGISSSGSLSWDGSASGDSLWVSTFAGAGLADCDSATSKLLWDTTTQKFSCGTDDDVPESGDFGNAVDLNADGSISDNAVDAAAIATDAVGTAELDDDANTPNAGDIVIVGTGAASFDYITPNAGTDISADLEEETHASEHESGGDDTIDHDNLTGFVANEHVNWVDGGGATQDLSTTGFLSGSSLTVDGSSITINGVAYTFPSNDGNNGDVLTSDGGGTLTWQSSSVGVGSGGVVFLAPEYPHSIYTASGSAYIGQLTYDYDATNRENYYRWTTTKGTVQNYWIVVRVRVPDNFSQWDSGEAIQFRYRTGNASNAVNNLRLIMVDTAGVTQLNVAGLANTSWTTSTSTISGGTYTKSEYITLIVKLETTSSGSADAGFINLNWETSAP